MRQLLFVTALWGVCACAAVGPDYVTPEIPTPAEFDLPGQAARSATDTARWWETFGDDQLSEIVEGVLDANLDLGAAVERIEAARAAYGIATSARFPTLDASGGYSRARSITGDNSNRWAAGAAVAWEMDVFGRVRRSIEVAEASLEAQIEDLRSVHVALAAETVATYFLALSLQERLAIATGNVVGQEKSLMLADTRFNAGMADRLDPAQARVNLHSTQAAVPILELQLRRALHRLAVLQGKDPRSLIDVVDSSKGLPSVPDELMVGVPADLMRNRPDIRALERQLAAQTAQVGVAVAALYPSINLSGAWDILAANPGDLFSDNLDSGSIGFPVSVPIFNAGRLREQVSAEEALVRQLDLQLRQQILIAQEEVENALVSLVGDRRQRALLTQAAEAAKSSVSLSRELYTSGQSDFQNVLDAERSLFSLEDEVAQAKLNSLLDIVDLYLALGGGWADHGELEEGMASTMDEATE